MSDLRFAIFGAGFWTRFQLAAWREVGGAQCVAIYNRTRSSAEAIAREFGIPRVYEDPQELLDTEKLDFVDNITEVGGHMPLSILCAQKRVACICQKPMAASLEDGRAMVAAFDRTRTPFFIHENWRWQAPMRALRKILHDGTIGAPFRARFTMISGFDCWESQPALRDLERFILTDLGTHILDVARCLFGEATSLYCRTRRTLLPAVRGENVATILLSMGGVPTDVVIELAYAKSPLERECFPQTLAFLEGPKGTIEVTPDYWMRVTTCDGTHARRHPPARYAWADPRYEIAHESIVECHRHLLDALRGGCEAETTGRDNLRTLELVFACYESAAENKVVLLNS